MPVPFVDLGAQYRAIRPDVDRALLDVVASGQFILGPELQAFEEEFAAYCETHYAVGVDCGTSALELALRALNIGPGDEVITAANTFIATVLAIMAVGARPVLADVDPATYTLAPEAVIKAITLRTRAVIPVHLYGQPAQMDRLLDLADYYKLAVIEDACQAHGARFNGRRVGRLGTIAAFSFYPAKNLGAYGDGGMLVTESPILADRIRLLRDYGQRQKYHHLVPGHNHRLDCLQAAVLRVKLRHLDEWNAARRAHAAQYGRRLLPLAGPDLVLPAVAGYAEHVYHLYVIRAARRAALQAFLRERDIATGIHYPIPIHLQPACQSLGYRAGDFPVTEGLAGEILSLPMYAELSDEQIATVCAAIGEFMAVEVPEPALLAAAH